MPKYYDRDTRVAYVQQIEEGRMKVSQAARDLGAAKATTINEDKLINWLNGLRSADFESRTRKKNQNLSIYNIK